MRLNVLVTKRKNPLLTCLQKGFWVELWRQETDIKGLLFWEKAKSWSGSLCSLIKDMPIIMENSCTDPDLLVCGLGALLVSILASPVVLLTNLLHLPKLYSLYAVRLVLGGIVLSTLRFFRIQIKKKFGSQVEAFFVILTVSQFHLLFYCTRPLPNILAFALVNLAYGFWFKGSLYAALNCMVFATLVFRCDILLLIAPLGLELLLTKSVSFWKALTSCLAAAFLSIGLTVLVDSVIWKRLLWPELEVFWFNSVLNKSSEWGTHPFHWYFTSALPRSLLAAYPLFLLGVLLDRRVFFYILPVLSFVLLYSKLPHKELRFIISSIPVFNFAAAVAASRLYNNRKKSFWKFLYIAMLGFILGSLACTAVFFMASYKNYPSGYALKALHRIRGVTKNSDELRVHIDTFSAMNGISRFCEYNYPWRTAILDRRLAQGMNHKAFIILPIQTSLQHAPLQILQT
ncbi:dol-P-Man:Man(7)GlcNAc(2)-PP-Dol alpha-1,6-mannosyltransferase isoform X3 [Solanum dulcamara]|uniref:dol-P-Man:Man(7)GlcNAc(2)-PP-Dol alpha-1,6-mannosyltransferase isoform X3 n=1 Tax=Solanum dulcamara TaxID=45834 RepID=UPI002485D6C7|nr:dol-P-Man:Man(7)GlcNAc(2)-PP-Dol alpha-1,6-mannosyltransferase isoform X3 [Solanum dulcamara]